MLLVISPELLNWIGYIASFVVLVSLLMTSVKKLRWINLAGSVLFGFYGFMIGSIPTGIMNVGIAIINIYFLRKMYAYKEYFKLLDIKGKSDYLHLFLDFYKDDVQSFTNLSFKEIENAEVRLLILRDMAPASLFTGNLEEGNTLRIQLDYAIPMYRDFKLGSYLFDRNKQYFTDKGITKLIAESITDIHTKYLLKMGFKQIENSNDFEYYL